MSGGGYGGRFGTGMSNPNVGGVSTRKPTARVVSGGGNAPTATQPYGVSHGSYVGNIPYRGQAAQRDRTPTHTRTGRQTFVTPGWLAALRRKSMPGFNEPEIPGMRDLGEVERYAGEMWAPDRTYDEAEIDPTEMIESRFALIDEELGTEMSEAARRFGQTGGLMSGGGRGAGFVGTLGESERGAMRDKRQIASDRIYAAQQAEANRRAQAFESEMGRSLAAHEGHEGRRFGDVSMANEYGLGAFDRMSDYDRWKYGAELGAADREQADAMKNIELMMALYGG